MPLNGTIANVVLWYCDFHFEGQTSCYAFAIKKIAQVADVPGRFVSTCMTSVVELILLILDHLIASLIQLIRTII